MAANVRVAVAGLGAVGWSVAKAIDGGAITGLKLVAVSAAGVERARKRLVDAMRDPPPVLPAPALAEVADVVVECLPAAVFRQLVEPAVMHGRVTVCVSAGALLQHYDLVDACRTTGARIMIPSGAVCGLDGIRAAAEAGPVHTVRMVTRKPPAGLRGAPHLERTGMDVDAITSATCVFRGSAAEGARGFPANVNVAAAVALAGIGPKLTQLEVWADPSVDRNVHRVMVDAEAARLDIQIENVPSAENPRTGRIVAPSVVALLRRLVTSSSLVTGT